MSDAGFQKDLIVLVPGQDDAATINGLLSRPQAIHIRPITWDIQRHPERDPGCRLKGHEFLRRETKRYRHALVMFDLEGCGADSSREVLERLSETALSDSGWADRAATIILDPELEIWIWSNSPHVAEVLGWKDKSPGLRDWLVNKRHIRDEAVKPSRPKEAMEEALREVRKPRSSAMYEALAAKVSLTQCRDAAFLKFQATLQKWFAKHTVEKFGS